MQNPTFLTLNGHRIKVQRWHRDSDGFSFTTVIRGENLGNALVTVAQSGPIEMVIDNDETLVGHARITDRRASGTGPTAVHRIEFRFTPEIAGRAPELNTDQKLDLIMRELRAIRGELASLRRPQGPRVDGGLTPPPPGATMLDFEIPIDDAETDE